jgi:ferredoxin-NADP reductase
LNTDPAREWQVATVTSVYTESPRVKLFRFTLPERPKFRAGQYYDIRLTSPDGYQAQRSYSVTSSPDGQAEPHEIEFAIELIKGGEVSSYFHEFVSPGDQIEMRGPIGGHFTLSPNFSKPVLLVAGGSGIAPIISMLRHRRQSDNDAPVSVMFSVRTEIDLLFGDEIEEMANENPNFHLIIALTRTLPGEITSESPRETRRIDRPMIDCAVAALGGRPARAYVCGGTEFVETVGSNLLDLGMKYDEVRTERFGP